MESMIGIHWRQALVQNKRTPMQLNPTLQCFVQKEKFSSQPRRLGSFLFPGVCLSHLHDFFNNIKDSSPDALITSNASSTWRSWGKLFLCIEWIPDHLPVDQGKGIYRKDSCSQFLCKKDIANLALVYLCIFIGFVIFPVVKKLMDRCRMKSPTRYYLVFANNFDFMHSWPVNPMPPCFSALVCCGGRTILSTCH